ncbi:MAG: ThuA domain-containing protein [Pirellulaceae bacterium]
MKRVLLIPTKLDHAWATHMYSDVCQLMAATLNLTPGVEAIVSPDLDWPRDPKLLDEVDAIVYYSRPAGDILLSPAYRPQAKALLERGVGLTAIHWSTGAEMDIGPTYESLLGGWFNFEFSGLTIDRQPLQQLNPTHPVCRGWDEYLLRDEFYLNLRFDPRAIPLLKVRVNDQDQTVAWVHHREDGGRSFGTTLGHFHDNFADPRFRKMLANGILWTAGVEIPEAGLPVDIPDQLWQLEDATAAKTVAREWTYDSLREALLVHRRRANEPPPLRLVSDCFNRHPAQHVMRLAR